MNLIIVMSHFKQPNNNTHKDPHFIQKFDNYQDVSMPHLDIHRLKLMEITFNKCKIQQNANPLSI
jgi:hypothetical protein